MLLLLNLLILVFFAGTCAFTIANHSWTNFAFINFSYYIILALVATWSYYLFDLLQEKGNISVFFKTHRNGIIFSLLLASFVNISVPHHFRVLADETNTLSVARSMAFNKQAQNITEGKWYYGMLWPSNTVIDKRPLLFPFFISLTDTATGYRPENAFLFNAFALWACLFLIYLIIRPSLTETSTFAGMLLVISQPIISLSATSTSFEIFNLLFILASFLSLKYFITSPDHRSLAVFCLNLLMLANIRYESFSFLAGSMAILIFIKYIRLEYFKRSSLYALMAFFCLPLIWQRVIYSRIPDVDMPGGSWIKAFSLGNAGHNCVLFFKYILTMDGHLGFAGIINAVGLIAVAYWTIKLLLNLNNVPKKNLFLYACCLASLLGFCIIIFCYDQARMTQHPMNGRMYMPLIVAISIMPVYALNDLVKNKDRLSKLLMAGAVGLFFFYHPIAMEDRISNALTSIREFRFLNDFLKKNADHDSLIISGTPGEVVIFNYGSIHYATANNDTNAILEQYKNHLISNIYVVQNISYKTHKPYPENAVDNRYQLQPIAETQESEKYYFRVSKVNRPLE